MLKKSSLHPSLAACGAAIWLAAIAAGYCWMVDHSLRPGKMADTVATPPPGIARCLDAGRFTLVVALHPECSCSRATVSELGRIASECDGALGIVALFADYETLPRPAAESRLWKKAARIPHLRPLLDADGGLRHELNAATSGECFLFSPDGEIIYHGGITSARGHEGASAGGDAVISLVHRQAPNLATAPVFGCTLDDH